MTNAIALADADADLVRRMAARDESALRELFAAYSRRLWTYAFRITGSEGVAEEVLQDSLLAAWNGARHFRGDARLITWLLGIVHHQALNAVRRKKLPTTALAEATELVGAAGADQRATMTDRRQALAGALARLPREQRMALELVFFQGLSLAEVATVSGCPVGTVKSRLSNAKTQLRRALEDAGLKAEDLL